MVALKFVFEQTQSTHIYSLFLALLEAILFGMSAGRRLQMVFISHLQKTMGRGPVEEVYTMHLGVGTE